MARTRTSGCCVMGLAIVIASACGGRTALTDDIFPDADAAVVEAEAGPPKLTQTSKLDMLFAIDNSPSMGDKQEILQAAVPQFIERLTSPWCVPSNDPTGIAIPATNGACESGYEFEFAAVKDIHIGIVSSSLGGGGSPDICTVSGADTTHQDDQGHLLNRTRATPEGTVAAALPIDGNGGDFLAWVPPSSQAGLNVTNEPTESALETDFLTLANGVQEHGCGLEAQLESWYRFLIQPDPYDSIQLDDSNPAKAQLAGIDAMLLKQRHDFLRPDSLVLILQITDEDDSWSDPMWLGGYGWTTRTQNFPGGPGQGAGPRGTTECDEPVDVNNPTMTGPNNPDCTSCAFPGSLKPNAKTPIGQDPNCLSCPLGLTGCPVKGWYLPANQSSPIPACDGINCRYTDDMRRRYGLNPQWNVQRYIDGLTSPTVPDRDHENHDTTQYAMTQKNCTNPLFAKDLPDGSDTSAAALCPLATNDRGASLVYYLIIGGVPWQLLAQDPFNTSLPFKRTLADSDWRRIIGQDPSTYQLDGIDPHMIESTAPRAGIEGPGPAYNLGTDPINGRDWNTLTSASGTDLQFACTFDLVTPKDCTAPENTGACDCVGSAASAADGPPVCDVASRTTQLKGKAYPTIRQLRVAKGLGDQGIVASICPRNNAADYFQVLFTRIRSSIIP